MKRKSCGRLRWIAVMMLLIIGMVCFGGCGPRYEAIDIEKALSAESTKATETQRTPEVQETEVLLEESRSQEEPVPETEPKMPEIILKTVDEKVYVTGDQVNLRMQTDLTGDIFAKVNAGTELHRTGYHEEWSRVVYQEQQCFIASRYVSLEKPVEEEITAQETTVEETQSALTETAAETESDAELAVSAGTAAVSDVKMDLSWKYAEFSKINTGAAKLYHSESNERKNITVCVNAGHGTSGGSGVKTLCHPDGTPKVTGGTTGAGATTAVAVSGGMTFSDGTPEAKVTLAMAKILKEKLLAAGYDVLMIRESDDVQLDNIARTVIANNRADCHIALHWDSTTSDKGAFFMSVPNVEAYRSMEPVKSHWQKHNALGENLVAGLKSAGVKIFSGGAMEMDLTQTSYSTVPSVDIELGDKASDHSEATLRILADGLLAGLDRYFGQ